MTVLREVGRDLLPVSVRRRLWSARGRALRAGEAVVRWAPQLARLHVVPGYCLICQRRTVFAWDRSWLRDHYRCVRCGSVSRWRAVIHALDRYYPNWRELEIHESSPGGGSSERLRRECRRYVPSHFWPGVKPGALHRGVRCEDLERLTFPDESFDVVVTQDVFEHLLRPDRAIAEVARTLRSGGAHVFTVPYYPGRPSVIRAEATDGGVRHLAPPQFHINPISDEGSLVVTEWGDDLVDFIRRHGGLETEVLRTENRRLGLHAAHLAVFISRKS